MLLHAEVGVQDNGVERMINTKLKLFFQPYIKHIVIENIYAFNNNMINIYECIES